MPHGHTAKCNFHVRLGIECVATIAVECACLIRMIWRMRHCVCVARGSVADVMRASVQRFRSFSLLICNVRCVRTLLWYVPVVLRCVLMHPYTICSKSTKSRRLYYAQPFLFLRRSDANVKYSFYSNVTRVHPQFHIRGPHGILCSNQGTVYRSGSNDIKDGNI